MRVEELLKRVIGDEFVKINYTDYKSEHGDAVVIQSEKLIELVRIKVKEEIPFLDREVLKKYLPEKFQNDLILGEYQELAKFDHTILSNLLVDDLGLTYEVISLMGVAELVLSGSQEFTEDGYIVFYLAHEE